MSYPVFSRTTLLLFAFLLQLTLVGCVTLPGEEDPLLGPGGGGSVDVSIDSPQGNQTVNVGDQINFQGGAKNGESPYKFSWNFDVLGIGGAPVTSSAEDPGILSYTNAGNFQVKLDVEDSSGASGSAEVFIDVQASPLVAVITLPETETVDIKAGEAVDFEGFASGGVEPYSFLWDFDLDGTQGTDAPADSTEEIPGKVTFTKAGKYVVQFDVEDSGVEGDFDEVTVNVKAIGEGTATAPLALTAFPYTTGKVGAGEASFYTVTGLVVNSRQELALRSKTSAAHLFPFNSSADFAANTSTICELPGAVATPGYVDTTTGTADSICNLTVGNPNGQLFIKVGNPGTVESTYSIELKELPPGSRENPVVLVKTQNSADINLPANGEAYFQFESGTIYTTDSFYTYISTGSPNAYLSMQIADNVDMTTPLFTSTSTLAYVMGSIYNSLSGNKTYYIKVKNDSAFDSKIFVNWY